MSVDIIARALGGRALALIQNSGGRYVGNTALTPGQEQQQLTDYVKNETGGNPQMNDRVGDINTGIIWTYNGTKWIEGVVDPNAQQIQKNKNDIANLTKRVTKNEEDIVDLKDGLAQEKVDRKNKDDDLQDQIDALQALAKGVREVVGTYAAMEALDKDVLVDGDIINVLADETHDGINAYYRYNQATQTYTYIGSISPYYTKTEIDSKEQDLKDLIDKKQDKLVAGDGIELTRNIDDTVTIKAKLEGTLTDIPVDGDDKYFSNGGAYKLAPTLNGQKVVDNPTFYAPTTAGTEGQIITVNANGELVWVDNDGGGTVRGLVINGVEQPITPDTKILTVNTDDSLTENTATNTLSVSKANTPITKDEYNNLTQAEKEDESKVYLVVNDTVDTPVVISNINDETITEQSEDFTRSNKFLTEKFTEIDGKIDSIKVGFNGAETVVNKDLEFYAPTEAGTEGMAVVWDVINNKPVWGNVSRVFLNGAFAPAPEFYAPLTNGNEGDILKANGTGTAPSWTPAYLAKLTLNGDSFAGPKSNPTFFAPTTMDTGYYKRARATSATNIGWGYSSVPAIMLYNGFATVNANAHANASNLQLFWQTPNSSDIFGYDSVSIRLNRRGTYRVTMDFYTSRPNTAGWLYYYVGNSSGSTNYSPKMFTDATQRLRVSFTSLIGITSEGTWIYPHFNNTDTENNNSVGNITFTVQAVDIYD